MSWLIKPSVTGQFAWHFTGSQWVKAATLRNRLSVRSCCWHSVQLAVLFQCFSAVLTRLNEKGSELGLSSNSHLFSRSPSLSIPPIVFRCRRSGHKGSGDWVFQCSGRPHWRSVVLCEALLSPDGPRCLEACGERSCSDHHLKRTTATDASLKPNTSRRVK